LGQVREKKEKLKEQRTQMELQPRVFDNPEMSPMMDEIAKW
jgi:hypothetical protein